MIYLYDGWQCVEERELDGGTWVMRRQYVYGGQYIDEPVLFDNDTDGDEDIDVSYWYLHDTNYNVVALADNAGSTGALLVRALRPDHLHQRIRHGQHPRDRERLRQHPRIPRPAV